MKNLFFLWILSIVAVSNLEAKVEKNRAIYTHSDWRKTTPPPHYDVVLKDNTTEKDYIVDDIVFRLSKSNQEVQVVDRYSNDKLYDCHYKDYLIVPDTVVLDGKNYPVTTIGTIETENISYLSLPKTVEKIILPESKTITTDTLCVYNSAFLEQVKDTTSTLDNKKIIRWKGKTNQIVFCDNGKEVKDYIVQEGPTMLDEKYNGFAFKSITFPSTLVRTDTTFSFGNSYLEKCCFKEGLETLKGKFLVDCTNLKETVLPSTLKEVTGNYEQCCTLTKTVSSSFSWKDVWLEMIGGEKSYYKELIVPEGVKYIGGFSNYYNDTYPQGNQYISKLVLSSTVEEIGPYAFQISEMLEKIEIPENSHLKKIDEGGFWGIRISSFNCPDSLEEIGEMAFFRSKLSTIRIPANPKFKAGYFAFGPYLAHVEIPYPTTKISAQLFSGYENLHSVEFPNSVTVIEDGAFSNSGLYSVELPCSLVTIGKQAFAGNRSLSSVKFPNTLVSIGEEAFTETAIEELRLPKSLQFLSREAFNRKRVINFYVYGPPASIIESEGDGPSTRWTLHVLPEYEEAYETADYWKDFFKIETFEPDGINTIKAEDPEPEVRYDLQGRKQGNGSRGISVIKTNDGKTKKVWGK